MPVVDPSTFRIAQAQGTLPSSNADDSGREPVQSSPTGDQLQAPATQSPAQPPLQLQPGVTTPGVAPSSNPRLHGFIGSVLSGTLTALAGRAPTKYITDADGRVVPAPVQPTDTLGAKGRRLAAHALEGVAAGAQVPQQKSGAASALSGLGAGYSAATANAMATDQAARQQERENEEARQRQILNKANVSRLNAATFSLWNDAMQRSLDHDPERTTYKAIYDAASDPDSGLETRIVTPEEAKSMAAADSHTIAKHVFFPIGMKPVLDDNGQPVLNPDGSPKQAGQIAAIAANDDGKFTIPQKMADDIKKYGKAAGIVGEMKAGDEITFNHFAQLYGAIQLGKKQAVGAKPELVTVSDPNAVEGEGFGVAKGQKLQRRNPVSGDLSDPDATELLNYRKGQADVSNKQDRGEVTPRDKFIQDREDARAKLRLQQEKDAGKQTDVFGNTSALSDKEFNKRYDAFNKSKQYQNLQVLQGSYQQFQQAVNDINAGKDLTGAASVVGLFNAIGISATPLQGKGFRINENTIKEHVDARGVDQAAYQKLSALKTGAVITPQQLKDYAGIAANVYRDAYVNTANEEKRQLGYIDVLPLGNNEPVDPMTDTLYLKIAGGNRAKADEALTKSGWLVSHPDTHTFDAVAWQKTHPGQDVNAAIAYAKSQGYKVKQ